MRSATFSSDFGNQWILLLSLIYFIGIETGRKTDHLITSGQMKPKPLLQHVKCSIIFSREMQRLGEQPPRKGDGDGKKKRTNWLKE